MNKDTIIGIVGAVVLIAAMVGVFKYEGSQAAGGIGSNQYEVTWATESANGPSAQGSTALGSETEETLTVQQTNLTNAKFTLVWTPGQASTDTLKLTVTPPQGSGLDPQSVEEDDGEIVIEFPVPNTVPQESRFFANSDAEAKSRLAEQFTKQKGTGNWTVVVAFTDAQGASPVPGLPDPTADQEVTWELNTILDAYEATLKPVQ